jgi:phage anti-repressor protein
MQEVLNQLVPIRETKIGKASQKCVSARELHSFLEVKSKFADWIKRQIKKYQFVENRDFTLISQKRETRSGGTLKTYYALTLSMAKELSMVQNNKQGQQARQYFIQCEAKLQKSNEAVLKMAQDPIIAMRLAQIEIKERLTLLEAKTTTRPDYFTVAGYGTLQGIKVGIKLAANLGRKASAICKKKGFPIDKVPDPRFGEVGSYPKSVLIEVFQSLNAQNA